MQGHGASDGPLAVHLRAIAASVSADRSTVRWLLQAAANSLEDVVALPPSALTLEDLLRSAFDATRLLEPASAHALAVIESAAVRAAHDLESSRKTAAKSEQQSHEKYLSFLSHDLRGGLNGALLMIEVLKGDLAGRSEFGEQVQDLDIMRRSILETVSLMDRFLYAERFRKNLVQVKRERVDLRTIGDQLRTQFGSAAEENGLRLTVVADGVISGDRALLALIAVNLVGNAVKYSTVGEVHVKLASEGATAWRLDVTDDGPGLPPAIAAALMGAPARDALSSPGLGLGLAHLSAEALGANLRVEPRPKGTHLIVQRLA